jgi:3,4-dihydroxy 2-butanone 4-phosphate synthase/GTP cyclohydrolase II
MTKDTKINTIIEAIEEIRLEGYDCCEMKTGNEATLSACRAGTPEIVNHGIWPRMICVPLRKRCEELDLEMMVGHNSSLHETDLRIRDCEPDTTPGISAKDRH